jgi:Flp pilus assembly protein TadD
MFPIRAVIAIGMLCVACTASAQGTPTDKPIAANDASAFRKLIEAGQSAQALQRIDAALVVQPRDAQMRFLKGVALTHQHRTDEAIAVFLQLSEEFPELAEPYNNVAVLYASKSEFSKARAALEMAIRAAPDYAVAYENLGDVFLAIAAENYAKAGKLDSANASIQRKLKQTLELSQSGIANKRNP